MQSFCKQSLLQTLSGVTVVRAALISAAVGGHAPPGSYHAQGRKRLAHNGCQSRLSAFGFLCELQKGEVRRKSPEWAGAICDSTFYRKIHGWHFAFDTDTAAQTWISKQDRTKVSPTTATPTAEIYIHRVSSEFLQEERQNASCNSSTFHHDRE